MVKLRLRRRGRKSHPIYEIVAMSSRKTRDGQFLERIGQYNPMTQPSSILLDNSRALYWLNVGAQPTPIVRALLSTQGVLLEQYLRRKGIAEADIQSQLEQHHATVSARVARIIKKKREEESRRSES